MRSIKAHPITHLVERRHRLIGTPDLHLEESRFIPFTALLRTLHRSLGCIGPISRTNLVLPSLALKVGTRVQRMRDGVDVRTSPALQTVVTGSGSDGQERPVVGADWMDESTVSQLRVLSLVERKWDRDM